MLDIETKQDLDLLPVYMNKIKPNGRLKDPEKIAADIEEKQYDAVKEMAIDTDYNKIVCVGVKPYKEDPFTLTIEEFADWCHEPVRPPLVRAGKISTWDTPLGAKNGGQKFITFNGKQFDFPTIIKCGIKKDLNLPYNLFLNACDKYKSTNHVDLMERLGIVWGKFKSLDDYLQIYCGVKKETAGDEFFRSASDDDLKEHCLQDLVYTEQLFDKFREILL